jgi:hypothetical protein
VTRSHSTPHVDPCGGDVTSSERFLYWVIGALVLLCVVLAIVSRQGWL